MGKVGTRLPSFCLNRIRPHVRVRSPPIQSKVNLKVKSAPPAAAAAGVQDQEKEKEGSVKSKPIINGRKIMIVVDSSVEAKAALLWALSHTVQSQDVLILLHVTKVTSDKGRGYEVVNSLKKMSQLKRPEIEIETAVVEGKEKGEIIVEEARKKGAGLLVIGQKKRSMTWKLIMMWARASNRATSGVVDYCIQNADCMAVAVRRKSKKHGGFLITTKRHKDFWLLA
ncbi:universal stress protein PHOS32 isoform X2 [Euphorbia lathyris]|uniref:universal stress protein PHOS32 isoform X2 n=1 Tax=Euphorbia lathyris TaxID=212925 RepID=UPI003313B1E4